MQEDGLPKEFFNLLPLPILVNQPKTHELNSPIIFVNQQFLHEIGWTLEDIPDKNTWWQVAYPEYSYSKVIERQWELVMTNAQDKAESLVFIDANVTTKFAGIKRYKIYTQVNSNMLPGYNVIAFKKIEQVGW